jgi:SAM-dependent methyltransferase
MSATYDAIGAAYAKQRRPDPRIASAIDAAIGDARTVVNVGAGTGSYEPVRCQVVAVEPSAVMLAQRAPGSAPVVQGVAESLPFRDRSFDVALAVLTIHHWSDQRRGLAECARVARRRVVLFTADPTSTGFWLVDEYFPEMLAVDRTLLPSFDTIERVLGAIEVYPVPVPADCVDGFLGAYWRRPAAYLDPSVRGGISSFARKQNFAPGLARLERDLKSGVWNERHADLLEREELDIGYRLVVAAR